MPFEQVQEKTAVAQVAEQIRAAILGGDLKPGDRLAPEHELAQTFGVSRVVVREALRELSGAGLVQSGKRGRDGGARVAPFPTEKLAEMFTAFVHLQAVPIAKLVEFRVLVESGAARWAARRRSPEALEEMRRVVEEMEEPGLTWNRYHELDVSFHLALAAASDNPCTAAVMQAVREAMKRAMLEGFATAAEPDSLRREMIVQHRKIYELVGEGRDDAAERAVRGHIVDFYRRLFPVQE